MNPRNTGKLVITLLALILMAGLFLSGGCKIVPIDENNTSQSSTSSDKSTSTNDKTATTSDSQNSPEKGKDSSPSSNQQANRTQGDYAWPNGDKYHGQLLNGLPDGNGTSSEWNVAWDSYGEFYTGEWKDGKINGYGKLTIGTDGSYFEGNFKDNLPNGEGILHDPMNGPQPGTPSNWTTAKKDGHWLSTSDKGERFSPNVPGEKY